MGNSAFLKKRMVKVAPPKEQMLRKSNFAGGQDTLTSIEELGENVSPYLRNVRNVHQGSIGNRKGPGTYSVPAGQVLQATQTSVTGATNVSISTVNYVASSFTPSSTNSLTRIDLNLKNDTVSPTSPLLVEIWTNVTGAPGAKIAGSSVSVSATTATLAFVPVYFVEAPVLASGTTYWIVTYMQSGGVGGYIWSASTTYTTGAISTNNGMTWTSGSGMNLKTYLATSNGTLGGKRFTFSNNTKVDLIAVKETAGTTGVYLINANTGALTVISTGLNGAATYYSFDIFNDIIVYANGYDAPHQWDGTTDSVLAVSPVSLTMPAIIVKAHKNHLFLLEGGSNRVIFSQLGDISATGWLSTNFIYVPSPKSGDPVNSMFQLQDYLWFGTRKTKYTLYGSDLSSFALRQSLATKGIMGPTCVTVDGNFAYFISDDGIYSLSGSTDQLLSKAITPDFQNIADITKGCLIVWNNTLRYYCAGPGSAVANQLISLDLVNGGWFYDTNQYVSQVWKYKSVGDPLKLVECSSLVGAAYYAEQKYSDLGKPIKMEYFDAPLAFADPGVYKQILFLYVRFIVQSGNYLVDVQIDKDLQNNPASTLVQQQGAGTLWGVGIWGHFLWGQPNFLETTIPVSGENRWYQLRLVNEGVDSPVEFTGYTDYYLSQAPR